MSSSPLSDVVSSQYARWVYPQPILDLPEWLQHNWQWFDPSHSHRLFWPKLDHRPHMDILVAGCGTHQAAVIAYNNPSAQVTAVDVSEQSLSHHQFLKDKYQLNNLVLHQLPIEQIGRLTQEFDLIISTGVLHHLACPVEGIQALAQSLRVDGVMAIMLYAKYGRLGVDMMQSVFREMGLRQDDTSVLMVREALATLAQDHPVKSYLAIAPDLGYDAGLVDTFLHGRERNYTIDQCLELLASAGLIFQDLLFKAPYHPPALSTNPFHARVSELPKEQQWAIMEKINYRNGCHFFMACKSERAPSDYKIDFSQERALDYIPSLRHRCSLDGPLLRRHDWSMSLNENQQTLVALVDGQRSIRHILQALHVNNKALWSQVLSVEKFAVAEFRRLWQLDFMAMSFSS